MFPIAHAWLVERLVSDLSPAHYLGCIWPDMLFESPLTHTQSHRSGARLVAHANTLSGSGGMLFRQFVVGVLTHGSEPRGFDWYSDEEYGGAGPAARGYAFQKGKELASAAARACDVPDDAGWWKAHNIVEMAFECPLYLRQRERGKHLVHACEDGALVAALTTELAHVFAERADLLAVPIRRFPDVARLQPESVDALADTYAIQTRLRHRGAQPDPTAIARLITRAQSLIADDYQSFLDACETAVGAMLRSTVATP
jgi:hypothetical protein